MKDTEYTREELKEIGEIFNDLAEGGEIGYRVTPDVVYTIAKKTYEKLKEVDNGQQSK